MFWTTMIAATVAIALIKLGALSVWVAVFRGMLAAVLAVLLALGLAFAWRRYRGL